MQRVSGAPLAKAKSIFHNIKWGALFIYEQQLRSDNIVREPSWLALTVGQPLVLQRLCPIYQPGWQNLRKCRLQKSLDSDKYLEPYYTLFQIAKTTHLS